MLELFEEAVAIGIRENELDATHWALTEYAGVLWDVGYIDRAEAAFQKAKEIADEAGNLAKAEYNKSRIEFLKQEVFPGTAW